MFPGTQNIGLIIPTMEQWMVKEMELAEMATSTALIKEKNLLLLGNDFWTLCSNLRKRKV